MDAKISASVGSFSIGSDRFVNEGYRQYMPFEDKVRAIANLEGVSGIEVSYPNDINEQTWPHIERLLSEMEITISALEVDLVSDKQWRNGSLSSADRSRRSLAISLIKGAMNFAQMANIKMVTLFSGQDGHDHIFQNDYAKAYIDFVGGLKECAKSYPDINIGIEYKKSEPRLNCLVKNAGMALSIAQSTGCANVGITLDVGHSLSAGENPAEVASLLLAQNRLFHIHINDIYGVNDESTIAGASSWPQYIEFFYWIKQLGYDGWYNLDITPSHCEPDSACDASVAFMQGAMNFVETRLPTNFHESRLDEPSRALKELFEIFFSTNKASSAIK